MIVRYGTRTQPFRATSIKVAEKQDAAAEFLSADVGVQKNGMTLSVISMLSRQDIDPVKEVEYLSALQRGEAVARLATVILSAGTDLHHMCRASTLASDLISLLPAFPTTKARPVTPPRGLNNGPQVSNEPAASVESDDLNPLRVSIRNMHYARILVALIACAILLVISIVDPQSIVSPTGSSVSSPAATGPAPALSDRAHLLTH